MDYETNKWWPTTAGVSKGTFNNIEHDHKKRENFHCSSYIHKGFISTFSLLNNLMKILFCFDIFNRVIFKDLGSGCYGKNSISQ